jgi:hypothetical protein
MAPGRIGPRAPQESCDSEGQWKTDGGWESNGEATSNTEWEPNGEATSNAEWDSTVEWASNEEWVSSNEWGSNSTNVEEVSVPVTEDPAPVFTEEALDHPVTSVDNEEASLPNNVEDDASNSGVFDADNKLNEAEQKAESEVQQPKEETEAQNEPVEGQVSQEEQPELTPEKQKAKDREEWQRLVAERKARFREFQRIKNEKARKLFDIFEEKPKRRWDPRQQQDPQHPRQEASTPDCETSLQEGRESRRLPR